jgi:thioesterase domain-containing protein
LEAASGSTIESLARSIHEQLLDAQCDRTLPLEILTQHLRARAPERSGDATRFGLTYRHIDDAPRTLGGSMAQLIVIEQLAARFGLCLHVEQRTSGLRVWLEASSSYFSLEALRQIGASFTGVLEGRPPPPRLQVAAAARLREAQYAGGTSGERVVLAELWHKLLGSAPTEMSDFFTSGGSSLLAMRLAAAVHKRLGRRLMLNQFLRRPTLDGLVNSIRDDIEHPFAEFSDARADEDRSYAPWCVAIPGSSGRAIDLYRLWSTLSTPDARAIDMLAFDLKTIGIGEQDTFDTKRFFSRFTALTHAYAIANDRRGPITVMGYSLGGLVALDMARTLADLGHTVERIVLLDAYAPQYLRRTPAWLLGKLNARVRTLGKPATPRRPQKIEHDSEDAQAVQISRATWRLIHHELGRWRPSTLLTHTTLVRSSSAGMSFRPVRNAATNGLGPWLRGPLDVRVLDVEHLAMLTADADRVAEALRSVLTQPRSAQPRESRESQPSPTANRRA